MPIDEQRIRAIAREESAHLIETARAKMMATLTAHIDASNADLRQDMADLVIKVDQVSMQGKDTDRGQIHVIEQVKGITETGQRLEKKIDAMAALVMDAMNKLSFRQGGDETKRNLYKGAGAVVGVVGGATGVGKLVQYIAKHWSGNR